MGNLKKKREKNPLVFPIFITYNIKMMLVLLTIIAFNFESGKLRLEKRDSVYITYLQDGVRIYNDTMEIEGDSGIFNEARNTLFLKGVVRLRTKEKFAIGDSLLIRKNGDIILIMGRVTLTNKDDTLNGRTIIIEKDSIFASYNVRGYLKSKNIAFVTDSLHGWGDSVYILMGDNTHIVTLDSDSISLTGTQFYFREDAVYSPSRCAVRQGKYTVEGDTLYYFVSDSQGIFLKDVKVRWDSGYAIGDTMYFYTSSRGLDSVFIHGDCKLKKQSAENTVTLHGSMMKVYFDRSGATKLTAYGAMGVLLENKSNE